MDGFEASSKYDFVPQVFANAMVKTISALSLYHTSHILTRALREPGGPCTKSMELSVSRMERVKDNFCKTKWDVAISW